jgi:hypothetical protein
MKSLILFFSTFLLFLSFFKALPAQESEQQIISLINLPQDIIQNNLDMNIVDIALLKQTCKQWNIFFDYHMANSESIEKIDEVICTKWLCRFARTKQEKNFERYFLHNNAEKRKKVLKEWLKWKDTDSIEKYMHAYCVGANVKASSGWIHNKIALTIVCLSSNPNIIQSDVYVSIGNNYHGKCTVLILAALLNSLWLHSKERLEIVKLSLANSHININIQDDIGNTALMCASHNNKRKIVKLLLANQNIDINKQNSAGDTALILASYHGCTEIVKLLLAMPGIKIDVQNNNGQNALIRSVYDDKNIDIVRLLLQSDINITEIANGGETALLLAVFYGCTEIVKLLLTMPKVSIILGLKNGCGETAYELASAKKHTEIIGLLNAKMRELDLL